MIPPPARSGSTAEGVDVAEGVIGDIGYLARAIGAASDPGHRPLRSHHGLALMLAGGCGNPFHQTAEVPRGFHARRELRHLRQQLIGHAGAGDPQRHGDDPQIFSEGMAQQRDGLRMQAQLDAQSRKASFEPVTPGRKAAKVADTTITKGPKP